MAINATPDPGAPSAPTDPAGIRELMLANLFAVFSERDHRVELTEWRAASLDAAAVALAAPRLLSVSTTRTGRVGARFWGQVRGFSGRLRVLQGRGAGSGKTGRIAGKARWQARSQIT